MKNKLKLLLLVCILSNVVKSQITVLFNDKEITEGSIINLKDLKTIKIKFKPTSKVNTASNGLAKVIIQHFRTDGQDVSVNYEIKAFGTNACETLINNNGKVFRVANSENDTSDFDGRELYKYWQSLSAYTDMQPVSIKLSVIYRDKVGYEKYGTPTDVVPPFSFKLNPVNEIGYTKISELNAKLSKQNADKLKFKYIEPRLTGPVQDKIFNKPSKTITFNKEGFNGLFMRAFTLECESKSQDEYIKLILDSFEDELISNSKLGSIGGSSKTGQWKKFFPSVKSDKIGKFKKTNKEDIHEQVSLGQLNGYKVNFKFNNEHNSLYILANPKDKAKVILFYSDHLNVPENESFSTSIAYIESFLKSIEF